MANDHCKYGRRWKDQWMWTSSVKLDENLELGFNLTWINENEVSAPPVS